MRLASFQWQPASYRMRRQWQTRKAGKKDGPDEEFRILFSCRKRYVFTCRQRETGADVE